MIFNKFSLKCHEYEKFWGYANKKKILDKKKIIVLICFGRYEIMLILKIVVLKMLMSKIRFMKFNFAIW
ncbi:hypothetical protein D4R71_07510 [bacterium]|nr:MAG: hypothetical protein D4R71_07510 [bacterium]